MENRIWLKGDTHLHTCNSDGKLTPGQLVEACQQAGLDYAIITDHNYNTVKASYTDKNLLVMQGQEITDDLGLCSKHKLAPPNFVTSDLEQL